MSRRFRLRRSRRPALRRGLLAAAGAASAKAERVQQGPDRLPRRRALAAEAARGHTAPVSVRLAEGWKTTDGSLLPRVTRIELGLPGQGVIDTEGLPVCIAQRCGHQTRRGP